MYALFYEKVKNKITIKAKFIYLKIILKSTFVIKLSSEELLECCEVDSHKQCK